MADIKLFSLSGGVQELPAQAFSLERELQKLVENNMPIFFGVTFLESEYATSNGGRMDSLGLDENYCPVIFEYKRSSNENVINQGLFYLDWLMDHKADFELLVMNKLGKEISDKLDWSFPRVICIASSFTKYDEHAVKQMKRNIDLVRYKKFDNDLLLFELTNTSTAAPVRQSGAANNSKKDYDKTFEDKLALTTPNLQQTYAALRDYILSLGDDVSENYLKLYVAFKKLKNIACVEIYQKRMILHLKLNPDDVELEEGFTRDMRGIGHYGTGELEVIINGPTDFEKAKPLIEKAYNLN